MKRAVRLCAALGIGACLMVPPSTGVVPEPVPLVAEVQLPTLVKDEHWVWLISTALQDGVTVRFSDDPCNLSTTPLRLRTGCYDPRLDEIEILSGMSFEWTLYVVLHELGHRALGPVDGVWDECAADYWALEHGATFSGYGCPTLALS